MEWNLSLILSQTTLAISLTETYHLIFWGVLFVIFLIIEAATASLTTIWFAAGALAALILGFFGVGTPWQAGVFVGVSLILLVLTRPILKKYLYKNINSKTNKDTIIGKITYVTETINNIENTGYIKLNDVSWRAESADDSIIEEGKIVEVIEIRGNRLIVKAV